MHPFLAEIIENLKRIKVEKLAGPQREVGEGDHVVGVVSEELKRLWGLRAEGRRKLFELERLLLLIAAQHLGEPEPPPEYLEKRREFLLADSDDDAVNELFWAAVRQDFPEIAEHPSIGVRREWKVVWSEKDREEEGKDPFAAVAQFLGDFLKRRGSPPRTPPSSSVN